MENNQVWDWIVIGTGMGGSTFGHALAKAGRRVLFIEKGADQRVNRQKKSGNYLEALVPEPAARSVEDYQNTGRSHAKIWDATRRRWLKPILGSGTGGSSALFGMMMERFWKEDFEPGSWHTNNKSSLPDHWPVSFQEMEPYYQEAEKLFGVSSGNTDPLRSDQTFHHLPRPEIHKEGALLMATLQAQGLHPYTLPLARTWGTPCQFCQSFLCDHDCKNDGGKVCLEPALQALGASLLTGAEVLEITADGTRATGVKVKMEGRTIQIQAHNVALAAGALLSPVLLLKSRSPQWPHGLANSSGMVGRNLMRHYIDLIGVPSPLEPGEKGDQKEIGLNDFYIHNGQKFGTLADFGTMPPMAVIMEDLDNDMAARGTVLNALWGLIRPLARWVIARLMKQHRFMALIVEDLPFMENRVEPGANGADVTLHYSIQLEEWSRIRKARSLARKALGGRSTLLLSNANNTKFLAHACGTCRMGDDPRTNVVNRFNRAHGVENLYVVDSSFFPSSGGINPALTIAANALRVAQHIVQGRDPESVRPESMAYFRAGHTARATGEKPNRPRILFLSESVALSHPARLLQLAHLLDRNVYEIHLASDPRYQKVLGPTPFLSHPIDSIPSETFDRKIASGGIFFTEEVLETYVQQELALFKKIQPDLVVGELRPSLGVSARLAGIPYINILNAYWSPTARVRHVLPEYTITEWLPQAMGQFLYNQFRGFGYALHIRPLNAVRRRHGLAPLPPDFRHAHADGDWTLYPDLESLFPIHPLPKNHHYIAPVSWSPKGTLPPWWDQLPSNRPIIYANLGSSGRAGVLQRVLDALGPLPVTILAATAGRQSGLVPPANAFLADFLPGQEAAARADLVITNGGNMSAYQALAKGKPVLGLASNIDQFLNMAALEDAGAGKVLRANSTNVHEIAATVIKLLNETTARRAAESLSAEMAGVSPTLFNTLVENATKPGSRPDCPLPIIGGSGASFPLNTAPRTDAEAFDYPSAFSRNRGLVSHHEQARLKRAVSAPPFPLSDVPRSTSWPNSFSTLTPRPGSGTRPRKVHCRTALPSWEGRGEGSHPRTGGGLA